MAVANDTVEVAGRPVRLPCEVRDASVGSATFLVRTRAARRWLPTDRLAPVEVVPGRALLTLTMIDYRDNDLGDYRELSVALVVRMAGGLPVLGRIRDLGRLARGELATYIHHLPVDQPFTCAAGRAIWGFPKTEDRLDLTLGMEEAVCTWRVDDREVLTLTVPRGGTSTMPDRELATYTMLDGRLHATPFVSGGDGTRIVWGGARLALGDHPHATELARLGLPRRALASTWMERMHGSFGAPTPR